MNDLIDLRDVLEGQARDLETDRLGRVDELRRRVRGARRRRRSAAGAVAVATVVVAATTVVTTTDGGREPGPADQVVGVQAPSTLTALGFGYDLVDGVDGRHGQVHVRLDASDRPRLVSWATSGEDQRVRLRGGGLAAPLDARSADFSDWVEVPEGTSSVLSVEAESGEPGLAIYEIGEERPEGVTSNGVTFPATTDEGRLLAAAVGAPGEAEVRTAPVSAPGGTITVHDFCVASSTDVVLNLVTGRGGEEAASGCLQVPPVDGRVGGSSTYDVVPGADLRTRAYLTSGFDGPPVADAAVQVGVAVYDGSELERDADGFLPSLEYGGHRYRLDTRVTVDPGGSEVAVRAPEDESPVLVVDRLAGRGLSSVTDLAGFSTSSETDRSGLATEGRGLVSPGGSVSLSLGLPRSMGGSGPQTLAPGQTAGLAFYVRAD